MILLLLLISAILVYCLIPGRVPAPWRMRLISGLGAALVAVAVAKFLFGAREADGAISPKYPQAAAYALGQQLKRDSGGAGGNVQVVLPDRADWFSDREMEGLKMALAGSNLTLAEPLRMSPSADTAAILMLTARCKATASLRSPKAVTR